MSGNVSGEPITVEIDRDIWERMLFMVRHHGEKEKLKRDSTTITLAIVLSPDPVHGGYVARHKGQDGVEGRGESKRDALINTLEIQVTALEAGYGWLK